MAGSGDIEARLRRATGKLLFLVAAAIILLVAAAFLVAAFYHALRIELEPVYACLATAGALALIAGLALILLSSPRSRPDGPTRSSTGEPSALAMLAGERFGDATKRWLSGHRVEALLGIFVLGFAVGWSPRLRQSLARWLRG